MNKIELFQNIIPLQTTCKSSENATISQNFNGIKQDNKKLTNDLDKLAMLNKMSFAGNAVAETQKSIERALVVGKNGSFDFRNKDISGIKFNKQVILDSCLDNTTKMSNDQIKEIKQYIGRMKDPGLASDELKKIIKNEIAIIKLNKVIK